MKRKQKIALVAGLAGAGALGYLYVRSRTKARVISRSSGSVKDIAKASCMAALAAKGILPPVSDAMCGGAVSIAGKGAKKVVGVAKKGGKATVRGAKKAAKWIGLGDALADPGWKARRTHGAARGGPFATRRVRSQLAGHRGRLARSRIVPADCGGRDCCEVIFG